ncbi:S41 family peptidase [Bacteroidota bacterium]
MIRSGIYRPLQILLIILLAGGMVTCEHNILNPDKTKLTKDELYRVMKENYLWYDTIPEVNPAEYHSLTALLDAIVLKPLDRWSDVMGTADYKLLYEQSEYVGHGIGMVNDPEGNIWIGFVYEGTTAESQGVARGWQVLSINGVTPSPEIDLDTLLGEDKEGVQNTFQFKDVQGGTTSMTLSKEIVNINPVLYSDVIDMDSIKAGYLVYQHFLFESTTELDRVFNEFQENDVTEVIVDLRYNPGGQVNVAQYLASLIAGNKAIKGTFVKFVYNDKKSERNISKPFQDLESTLKTTPERVFFITTGRSASSSEALINGLSPYLDVLLVGDDTYGKPVGSHSVSYIDSTLIPITFYMYNRFDEGEFFDGLQADSYLDEDIKIDFGDPDEKLLKEVLYYIQHEEWTGSGSRKSGRADLLRLRGINSLTGAI